MKQILAFFTPISSRFTLNFKDTDNAMVQRFTLMVALLMAVVSFSAIPVFAQEGSTPTPELPAESTATAEIPPTAEPLPPTAEPAPPTWTPTVPPPPPTAIPEPTAIPATPTPDPNRPSVIARMTNSARYAAHNSPFHKTTWVTYYGRPNVAIMGILGEFSIEELIPKLQAQADAYDEANGPELAVEPALHLVYGMATKDPGDDGTHLAYLRDAIVMEYINAAADNDMSVILDIQIGNLSPADALAVGLPYLQYPNVHLALDPEFAMSHPDQERPGLPIGFVTTSQINEAQTLMQDYMRENKIRGRRILIIHQFIESMIRDDGEPIERLYRIDLTTTADGFGGPWPKITKYNDFMATAVKFTGFKLFYRWDEPLMTERQVLGIDRFPDTVYMEVTPNLIIYQ
jgi:hypothetical protein